MQISKEDLFLPQNYLGEKAKQDQKTSSLFARVIVGASFSGGIRMVRQLLVLRFSLQEWLRRPLRHLKKYPESQEEKALGI